MIGKVTSLVAKKNLMLATRIEEALIKNESLESVSVDSIKRDLARSHINEQKEKNAKMLKVSSLKNKAKAASTKSSEARGKTIVAKKTSVAKSGKAPVISSAKKKVIKVIKKPKFSGTSTSRGMSSSGRKQAGDQNKGGVRSTSKLNVVGFRGRSAVRAG